MTYIKKYCGWKAAKKQKEIYEKQNLHLSLQELEKFTKKEI
jgi:hypothetical protein